MSIALPAPPVQAFIGLGANLGDLRAALETALRALDRLPGSRLDAVSSAWLSSPVDAQGPDYLNAVARLQTSLGAEALLDALQAIELQQGRERSYRNAPRTLDLDLLLYGPVRLASERLVLPHPRLHERAFVLRPLLELAPDLVLPGAARLDSYLPAVAGQALQRLGQPLHRR